MDEATALRWEAQIPPHIQDLRDDPIRWRALLHYSRDLGGSPARLPTTPSPAVSTTVLDKMRRQIEELQARTTHLGGLISPTGQRQA